MRGERVYDRSEPLRLGTVEDVDMDAWKALVRWDDPEPPSWHNIDHLGGVPPGVETPGVESDPTNSEALDAYARGDLDVFHVPRSSELHTPLPEDEP